MKYKFKCPEHGEVIGFESGYPPFEHVHCPVDECNYWRYTK